MKRGLATVGSLCGAALLALSACASSPPATYESAAALRDAYVKAGGTCNDWKQENKVKGAAQSGTCDGGVVVSTYLTKDAVQQRVADTKASWLGDLDGRWLAGDNWIVNPAEGDDVGELKKKLGGVVVEFGNPE